MGRLGEMHGEMHEMHERLGEMHEHHWIPLTWPLAIAVMATVGYS